MLVGDGGERRGHHDQAEHGSERELEAHVSDDKRRRHADESTEITRTLNAMLPHASRGRDQQDTHDIGVDDGGRGADEDEYVVSTQPNTNMVAGALSLQ